MLQMLRSALGGSPRRHEMPVALQKTELISEAKMFLPSMGWW